MKFKFVLILFFILFASQIVFAQSKQSLKPRIVVLTDISVLEPDDMQSLIRLLVHADMFEIEGLIASTGWSLDSTNAVLINLIYNGINAYENDLSNLLRRSNQTVFQCDESKQSIGYWPTPDYLRTRTMQGSKYLGMKYIGENNDSAGSDLIIKLADEDDDRPIWVAIWGGGNTLAQAIWRIQQERNSEELITFLNKIRVYAITDQDRKNGRNIPFDISSHQWMRREFEKNLMFIWDECAWGYQNSFGRKQWREYAMHIQTHGNLGSLYPKYVWGVEGDTPSFLHLMPNGLNNPEATTQVGWAGYSVWGVGPDSVTYAYTNHKGTEREICSKYAEYFYPAIYNNFAARMDWAQNGDGNRNPVVIINDNEGIDVLNVKTKQATLVTLDASKSYDPDGDNLSYKCWLQPEAGSYVQDVKIDNSNSSRATINIPSDSVGKTFHVVYEVTDNGEHNLTSYRRIIFEVTE